MDLGQIQIIVEGMTASGKSTVVDLLAERLGFKVMPEEFRDQHDLLSRFHHDRRWAFPMQLNFLVTRFAQYLCASEENDYIMDRSIFGDKVYATLYYKQHYFTDSQFGCYLTLYDSLLRNTASPRLLILVRCPFEEILRRIRARGRQDEIDAGVEYWRLLFDAYQPFLEFVRKEMQIPNVLELDLADPAFIKTPERVERFLDDVRAFFPERFAGLQ
ncbi:deoxynucleoside kinase [uncultured Fretibacterium sp.]|uniref:deoxynucleoside kinase n=1 Tax=uncultured Fretibacterium sp. TaxID=1678694 RepID=UPI00260BD5AD|nr:deoxynucleoside kinase [uncultured Fretibacterium sp.]